MTRPEISVLVPVYNRTEDLRRLLADLDAQEGIAFEVVVVDDGSTPSVASVLGNTEYRFSLVLKAHAGNLGAGAARNTAVAAASADVLLFIDSDGAIRDTACLRKHADIQRGRVPAPLGLPAPFLLHGRVIGVNTTYWGKSFEYSNWFMSGGSEPHELVDTHAPTHNLSLRREVFERTGPFDPEFMVAEDLDWAFRCRKAGVRTVYTPDIEVYHHDRDTMGALWRSYLRLGEFAIRVRLKHPGGRYSALFPKGRLQALFLIPLNVSLMTLYIACCTGRREPKALVYVPGMLLANIAYGIGYWRGLDRRAAPVS